MKTADYKVKTFRLLFVVILVALLEGCSHYDGEQLFHSEGCVTCHRFKNTGGGMGPDLTAVTQIRSDSSIDAYLQNPGKYNPRTRMPSFAHLSKPERQAIISFLKN
ncbi:MAG: cytochrome c [Deltaproteobacteria bacterium]|jgi:cytochrome c2|nr:cytochrome c [Deltaproteobacteria bacterium]